MSRTQRRKSSEIFTTSYERDYHSWCYGREVALCQTQEEFEKVREDFKLGLLKFRRLAGRDKFKQWVSGRQSVKYVTKRGERTRFSNQLARWKKSEREEEFYTDKKFKKLWWIYG